MKTSRTESPLRFEAYAARVDKSGTPKEKNDLAYVRKLHEAEAAYKAVKGEGTKAEAQALKAYQDIAGHVQGTVKEMLQQMGPGRVLPRPNLEQIERKMT